METLIVHVSQNSMDKGVVGQEAASQLNETVDKSEPKFNTHLVMCKIGPVRKGFYGRKTCSEEMSQFNDHLEIISLELDVSYPWSRINL